MVTKSILESFETHNGTEIYIQSSIKGRVSLSFDSPTNQYMQQLTLNEAKALANNLKKVIQEIEETHGEA